MYMHTCTGKKKKPTANHLSWHELETRGQFVGLALSFSHVGSRGLTQVGRLGCKYLYLLNHFTSSYNIFNPLKQSSFVYWDSKSLNLICTHNHTLFYLDQPLHIQYTRLMSSERNLSGHFSGLNWQILWLLQSTRALTA